MNSSANHFPTKWSKKEEEIESSIDYTILIIVVVLVVLVLLIIVILILYWFCYRGKQRNRKISDTGMGSLIYVLSFYVTKTVLVGPKWFWSDQIDLDLTIMIWSGPK